MKKRLAPLLLLTTAAIWGFAFSAQKNAEIIPATTQCALRSLLASFFLFAILPLYDRLLGNGRRVFRKGTLIPDFTKTEWIGGVACGTVLAIATVTQQIGMESGTDAGKCAFISALYVVLVPLLGLPFGKKPPQRILLGAPVAVIGFYFLCVSETFTLALSDLIVLLSALIYAGHILVIDRFSPNSDGVRISCVQLMTATVLTGIGALIFDAPVPPDVLVDHIPDLLFLGIGSSGIAYTFQILGQKDSDPAVASVVLSMESVFGAIGAAVALGERMSARELIGAVTVFSAVLISQIDPKELFKKKRADAPQDTDSE